MYIEIHEDQVIKYQGNIVPLSPYNINSISAVLKYSIKSTNTGSAQNESKGDTPVKNLEHKIKEKFDIPAWNSLRHTFTLALDTDCTQFMEANRTITISHWGNVNIKDHLSLRNNGAEFVGEYNPSLLPKYRPKSVYYGQTINLDYNTWGFSLRDELGNISSTTVII